MRTNLVPSKSAGDRSGAAPGTDPPSIWSRCGRSGGGRGDGGTCDSILLGGHPWENFSHHKITLFSIPQRGIPPLPNKPMDAISPRRRRIPSGAARERSSHVLDSTKLVRKRTCTDSTHQIPLIKVLPGFFKSRVPPFPSFPCSPASPPFPNPASPQERIFI